MKISLPLFFSLALSSLGILPATAQTFEWVKSEAVTGTFSNSQPFCTATDGQGNVLFAGLKNSKVSFGNSIGRGGDSFLQQYSPAGQLLFSHTLTGKVMVQTVEYGHNGDFFVVGLFNDSARFDAQHALYGTESFAIPFIAKYSGNGTVLWVRNMRANNTQARAIGSVAIDNSGNLYVAYNGQSSYQTFIKKYNDAGTELLHITQSNVRVIADIAVDATGNIYASGSCAETGALFNGTDFGAAHNYEKYLVSYSPTGVARWVKFVEDNSCYNSEIALDNSGHLYWAGPLFASTSFDTITAAGNVWSNDFFLTRFDTLGNIQWLREVPQINSADAAIGFHSDKVSGRCLTTDADNNVYLAGYLRNTLDWGNGIINTGAGLRDIMVQKYQPDGTMVWSKTAGSPSNDQASSVAISILGDVFIAGTAQDTIAFDTIQHTQAGIVYPILAKIAPALDTVIISSPVINTNTISIYPNPASGEVLISVEKPMANGNILIYNALGQVVKQQTVSGNQKEVKVDVKQLPSGMYVVQIQADNNVYRERLIKQ